MSTPKRAARRVGTKTGTAGQASQGRVYQNHTIRATANPLEQAAEVLCLLGFFPTSETARRLLFSLLDRRLRRVCAGGHR